jgi:hypothetical protein
MSSPAPSPKFESYVDAASILLDLPIALEYRTGVIANLERNAAIAQRVLEFPLPDNLEPAPLFLPEQP